MGTHWELERNIVGTHWEPGKNEKKKSFWQVLECYKNVASKMLHFVHMYDVACFKFIFHLVTQNPTSILMLSNLMGQEYFLHNYNCHQRNTY
jgi:hypothetical protein